VLDTLRTPGLFSERSLVIVGEADALVNRHRDSLEAYVADPAARSVLVLVLGSLPSNTRLYRHVQRVGEVISCKALKYGAVTRWVMDFAAKRFGKRIDWATAELLRDTVGDATGRLAGELEKLSIYVGDRCQIGRADVEALSPESRISEVFELTDALGRRDAAAAMAVAESLFEADRGAGFRLLGFLANQIRRLWEGRRLLDQGRSPAEICRQVGVNYFADRFIEQVRTFSEPTLAAGFGQLLQVDMAVKTGTDEPRQAFERFLLRMCRQ
jgi:DNA polymerase-3 subunit delta